MEITFTQHEIQVLSIKLLYFKISRAVGISSCMLTHRSEELITNPPVFYHTFHQHLSILLDLNILMVPHTLQTIFAASHLSKIKL